jgi:fructan beta-fructosidase
MKRPMNMIVAMMLSGAGLTAHAADEPVKDGNKSGAPAAVAVYGEKHRPQFHFTPKINWTNDPNGLVFYKGEYHLFFQHNPSGIEWGNMTWGHAVSKDLVHWTQLDHAILPDKLGTIFSGSAVVDWENTSGFGTADAKAMVCIYTAAGEHSTSGEKGVPYTQCLAYTTDGRKFTKYDKNPVLGHIAGSNRDPKVIWYAPEKKWVMALYLDGDTFALFESKDLKSWTKLHDVKFPRHSECPDFFPMPVDGNKDNLKWVFTAANGDYLIGSFDGKTFKPEGDAARADYGANYYAVQTFSDIPASDGRRIQIAWMSEARYPGMPFNQQMSFPCEMKLRTFPEGPRICRLPVGEIKNLYGKNHTWKNQTLKPDENPLKDVAGGLYDIQMQVDLAGAKNFGIKCRGAAVTCSAEKEKLTCLGKEAPIDLSNGEITLRILVDRTSLEIFANDGKVVMTSGFLPAPEMTGLELFADGGNPKILSMTVHELKSAWLSGK